MNISRELVKVARLLKADLGGVFVMKDDIEFIYDPFSSYLQIGMGGEWWSGAVKPGKNVFKHRKERVDPAYVPVIVDVTGAHGNKVAFTVTGGFYGKTTRFELSVA